MLCVSNVDLMNNFHKSFLSVDSFTNQKQALEKTSFRVYVKPARAIKLIYLYEILLKMNFSYFYSEVKILTTMTLFIATYINILQFVYVLSKAYK